MMTYPPTASRLLHQGGRGAFATPLISSFSTTTIPRQQEPSSGSTENSKNDDNGNKPRQHFVQSDIELSPGEPLPPSFHQHHRPGPSPRSHAKFSRHANDGRDAYWRPPWKNRAEIISAQDFANRPRVTFSEGFESMHDAMVVLGWLGEEDRMGMYRLYLEMMAAMAGSGKKGMGMEKAKEHAKNAIRSTNTSHEYVIRVVAQKYNVSTSRAAGVIQLQHDEEQLKKDPTFKVRHDVQALVDATVRDTIREVYQAHGEVDPLQFVEDPLAATDLLGREDSDSAGIQRTSELIDVDALFKQTKSNEEEDARLKIKNHLYVEDVDPTSVNVKLDSEAKRLLGKGSEFLGKSNDDDSERVSENIKGKNYVDATKPASKTTVTKIPPDLNELLLQNKNNDKATNPRRPRWKYAAQIINTASLSAEGKKTARKIKAKRHGRVVDGNTLIEEGGSLRVATLAELEETSWKHVRNESEFMFKGVKEAWMRRELEGEVGGWGLQEEVNEEVFDENEDVAGDDGESDKRGNGSDGEAGDEVEETSEEEK
mmetsp:Transcript_26154/g.53055  ORF Transcript_26154/g.53055 Transcript_26154/m.53055 type:complete len:540 (+) Transcript_26154:40-1659(+)